MPDENYCDTHNAHCIQIERLEKDICGQRNEIRDARKSLTHDMQRRDEHHERLFVTKDEFEPIKRLVYGVIVVILAEVIRRAFF